MNKPKPMHKYRLTIFDKDGKLIGSQGLIGSKDVNTLLGHLNKNYPTWFAYCVQRDGIVEETY